MYKKLREWFTPRRRTLGNVLFLAWLALFLQMQASIASTSSFKDEILSYDVQSLLLAALMALFGGTLRTIFTLAADNRVVTSMVRESWKDILVAIVAGFLVYITIEAIRAMNIFPIPSEVRFAAIVFAGWSRLSFFGWLNKLGTQASNAVTDVVTTRISSFGKKADPTPLPPAPLADKPRPFADKPFREV
jgi:hypothetical protein